MRQRGYQLSAGARFLLIVGVVTAITAWPVTRNTAVSGVRQGLTWLQQAAPWMRSDQLSGQIDIDELRRVNEALTRQVSSLRAGLEAAESLRDIQNFLTTTNRQGTAAAVIGYSDDPAVKTFVISAGSDRGISPGMAVVSDSGFFLGKVVSVRDRVATVRELRDSQATILARVENEPKSQGVVRGQRAIALRMTFLPKDDPVVVGDVVSTSGTEPLIPPGLPIGTVSDLTTRPGDVFQTVSVFNPIRLSEISAVAVIRPI